MKLYFEKIKVRNFLSVGSQPVELEYQSGIHLVTGKINGKTVRNGVGKSMLFTDAVVFGLFGKSIREVNMDQMVNSIVGEKCEVTLWFKLNGVPYRIERGIKPGYLRIFKNDEPVTKEKGNKTKEQKDFERKLGVTYTTFKNMITQNINSSKPFFDMSASERRGFLEDIVNLNVYGKMFELAKTDFNDARNRKKVLEAEFKSAKKIFEDKLSTYKKVQVKKDSFEVEKESEISELEDKLSELEDRKSKISVPDKDYETIKEKIATRLQEIAGERAKHNQIIESNNSDIRKNLKKIEKIEENPVCSICGTPTDSDHVKEHIEELQNEIQEYESNCVVAEEALGDLDEEYKSLKTKLIKAKSAAQKVSELRRELEKVESNINHTQKKLDEVRDREFDLSDVVTKEEVAKAKKQALIKKKELNDEAVNMVYGQRIKEILGDKGIKNYIIRKILPVLNKKMNEYLAMLNATYSIHFDEQLQETMKSRNIQKFNYKSFSSGEKKRIDLALMFTLIVIAKTRSSIDCNILILDEVLDTSLCSDGTESFMTFLKTTFKQNYPDLCTYVVTHKSDITEDNFDTVVELEKVNEFTKLAKIKKCHMNVKA